MGNMAIFKTGEAAETFLRGPIERLVKSFVIEDWPDSMLPE